MKSKRKSPKAIREGNWVNQITWGTFVTSGTLIFSSPLTVGVGPAISFSSDPDTGIQTGDWITLAGHQHNDRSNRVKHKKIHVARRRHAKGKIKPVIYEIENATSTTLTIKGGGTLTSA